MLKRNCSLVAYQLRDQQSRVGARRDGTQQTHLPEFQSDQRVVGEHRGKVTHDSDPRAESSRNVYIRATIGKPLARLSTDLQRKSTTPPASTLMTEKNVEQICQGVVELLGNITTILLGTQNYAVRH